MYAKLTLLSINLPTKMLLIYQTGVKRRSYLICICEGDVAAGRPCRQRGAQGLLSYRRYVGTCAEVPPPSFLLRLLFLSLSVSFLFLDPSSSPSPFPFSTFFSYSRTSPAPSSLFFKATEKINLFFKCVSFRVQEIDAEYNCHQNHAAVHENTNNVYKRHFKQVK